ncbi:glycosyl hydrolase family 28-related protein [Cronobacter malonaticus]|uniref:tail fiber/spike domain-containing protein n=1 Tax=Cronobacter malonaticus TaxID=413503 RepID=UPI00051970EB|nr:glycosyl hydrolase family 28-related protein [Cronobacter malonaticus]
MATQPTQNAVPSESPRDLKFNAGKIDEFVTSLVNTYTDRFGNQHYTIEGLRWLAQQAIAQYGWILVESFQDGAVITLPNQALRDDSTGEYYRWDGALPKTVPAGSTPASTGGIGIGAWIGIGDAALKTMLLSNAGSSMIGMQEGGTLKDVIKWVTPEQFGAKGDGATNDTTAIQAAIDRVFNNGGGVVRLGPKVYRAANLTLKPRVVIEGVTKETSMIMAPNGWTGNAVIMGQGYLTYKTDSASQVVPACYSSGLRNVTVHGNKSNYSGTPAKDVGCGVLLAGANIILDNIKIIYVPSVGLVTLDWGTNRSLYMAADPDRGWAHIGIIRGIRIQFCGNDCWHCEAQDYYLDDVEIVGAGDGFTSSVDTFSFWQTDELVSNFRVWRNIDIGFFHSYGNYNGYGFVAGPNTSTFYIRVKYDGLIAESCLIAYWFKISSYVQGAKLDAHEISQHKLVAKHTGSYPAACIVECNSPRSSNFGSIEIVQNTNDNPPVSYCGVGLYLGGSYNTVECYKYSRSPTIAAAYRGTGLVLEGDNNRIASGMIKGFFDTDSRGTPSTGIVASSGTHYVNCSLGFGNTGIRLVGGHLQGEIKNMGNLSTWQVGMESETTFARSMLKLYSNTNSNHCVVRGAAGAVSTTTTNVQQIQITGLGLPYVPSPAEVTPHLVIDASGGSSVPPQADAVLYIPALSSVNTLTFQVRLTNTTSPMQVTVGARLN